MIFVYLYRCIKEQLHTPELGRYVSFGILALSVSRGCSQRLRFISDVSLDPMQVVRLAAQCTALQLAPGQLLDVIEDALSS